MTTRGLQNTLTLKSSRSLEFSRDLSAWPLWPQMVRLVPVLSFRQSVTIGQERPDVMSG